MPQPTPNRRDLLKTLALTAGAASLAAPSAGAQQQTPAGAQQQSASAGESAEQKFSAYPYSAAIWVRINNRAFTTYRAHPTQKLPYFFPVLGPVSNLPMTEEASEPYPHHRSLYLGCDRVNGANFWQEGLDRGQIVSRGPKVQAAADQVVITDVCDWRVPDQPAKIEDHRRFTLTAPSPSRRFIDADITLTALEDITITKTNHSLFTIRVQRDLAPNGGGRLMLSNGKVGEKATFGEVGAWCGFDGTRLGIAESIVLMDHPANPWSPSRWFTRDYGNISPTPFNWTDMWKLPKGNSVRLRYRVVVSGGLIDRDEMNALHEAWSRA